MSLTSWRRTRATFGPSRRQALSAVRNRPTVLWITGALGALVVWMHRSNIGRLLKGTESRFGRNAKETGS